MGFNQEQSSQVVQKTNWAAAMWSCVLLIGVGYTSQQFCTLHDDLKKAFSNQLEGQVFEFYFSFSQSISQCLIGIFAIIVGLLCDTYSNGLVLVVQNLLVLIGQFGVVYSIEWNNFELLLCSRILLYLAGQTILISSKTFVNRYISINHKGLIFGIQSTFYAFSKGINLFCDPLLSEADGIISATMAGLILACLSLSSSYVCYFFDQKLLKQNQMDETKELNENQSINYLKVSEGDQKESFGGNMKLTSSGRTSISHFDQVIALDKKYWLFNFVISSSLVVSNVIDSVGPAFVSQFWQYSTIDATRTISIIKFFAVIMPFYGLILDQFNTIFFEFLTLGCILSSIGIIILTTLNPVFGSIIFAIGYNLKEALLFPIINQIVPLYTFGKAVGILKSSKNFLDALLFFIISIMVHSTHSYQSTFLLISALALAFTIGSCLLIKWKLSSSKSQQQQQQQYQQQQQQSQQKQQHQ